MLVDIFHRHGIKLHVDPRHAVIPDWDIGARSLVRPGGEPAQFYDLKYFYPWHRRQLQRQLAVASSGGLKRGRSST
jgi:hypothetical protein